MNGEFAMGMLDKLLQEPCAELVRQYNHVLLQENVAERPTIWARCVTSRQDSVQIKSHLRNRFHPQKTPSTADKSVPDLQQLGQAPATTFG